jgi:hypothetical protein
LAEIERAAEGLSLDRSAAASARLSQVSSISTTLRLARERNQRREDALLRHFKPVTYAIVSGLLIAGMADFTAPAVAQSQPSWMVPELLAGAKPEGELIVYGSMNIVYGSMNEEEACRSGSSSRTPAASR